MGTWGHWNRFWSFKACSCTSRDKMCHGQTVESINAGVLIIWHPWVINDIIIYYPVMESINVARQWTILYVKINDQWNIHGISRPLSLRYADLCIPGAHLPIAWGLRTGRKASRWQNGTTAWHVSGILRSFFCKTKKTRHSFMVFIQVYTTHLWKCM